MTRHGQEQAPSWGLLACSRSRRMLRLYVYEFIEGFLEVSFHKFGTPEYNTGRRRMNLHDLNGAKSDLVVACFKLAGFDVVYNEEIEPDENKRHGPTLVLKQGIEELYGK